MSGSLNTVQIIGNLGSDPETRTTQGGATVCNFSVATTETWNDRDGNKQESTEWHKVVFWGKVAEICDKYLKKGSKVYVQGSIQTRKWDDKDGNTRYTTEIKGRDMLMLDSRGQSNDQPYTPPAGGGGISDEDIPFAKLDERLV